MSEEGTRGAESRTAQRFCRTGDGRKIHGMKNFRVFHKIFAFETICYGMFQNCVSMFQFWKSIVDFAWNYLQTFGRIVAFLLATLLNF